MCVGFKNMHPEGGIGKPNKNVANPFLREVRSLYSLDSSSQEISEFAFLENNCVARATLWFCPVFFCFFYAADLGLFLETGKSLTCAVFTESVDLRPDC